ncbi:MAG: DNA cytosine methyltransferase [bacterium]|nr:DNA cytosine methyltransferase [bacterium]
MSVVDLFAGAGGLSEGFHRHNYHFIAYVEKNGNACDTLLTRHIYWFLKRNGQEDIYFDYLNGNIDRDSYYSCLKDINPFINAEISKESLPGIIKAIRTNMTQTGVKNIDIFIGGPPCQAYSLIGRARDKYRMEKDPRNILYKYYVELLKEFKPKIFVFENVPGILSAGNGKLFADVCRLFEKAGYKIDKRMLNASDFMVLQKRRRVILIGWQKSLNLKYPEFSPMSHSYYVKDVLDDLPKLKAGEIINIGEYSKEASEYLNKSGIRNGRDILTQHITRPVNDLDREIYQLAVKKWNREQKRLSYDELPESLKTHKNRKSFPDRFKVVADNLTYSHTVVAHISKDGHFYIHPDENQVRSLSVREAARLQSFPDDYFFEGARTPILDQIGNAVPPLMAEQIAVKIREYFS